MPISSTQLLHAHSAVRSRVLLVLLFTFAANARCERSKNCRERERRARLCLSRLFNLPYVVVALVTFASMRIQIPERDQFALFTCCVKSL